MTSRTPRHGAERGVHAVGVAPGDHPQSSASRRDRPARKPGCTPGPRGAATFAAPSATSSH
eukprot:5417155-Pyramimonas_sp.AAC.1